MKLKLAKAKTADQEAASKNGTAPSGYANHGTKLLKELVDPWSVKVDRVVAADLYFASVQYVKALGEMSLGFIGVVKQSPRQYPISHLQRKGFTYSIYCYGLVSVDEGVPAIIFAWIDRDRRYFIATRGSFEEGEAISRQR